MYYFVDNWGKSIKTFKMEKKKYDCSRKTQILRGVLSGEIMFYSIRLCELPSFSAMNLYSL